MSCPTELLRLREKVPGRVVEHINAAPGVRRNTKVTPSRLESIVAIYVRKEGRESVERNVERGDVRAGRSSIR